MRRTLLWVGSEWRFGNFIAKLSGQFLKQIRLFKSTYLSCNANYLRILMSLLANLNIKLSIALSLSPIHAPMMCRILGPKSYKTHSDEQSLPPGLGHLPQINVTFRYFPIPGQRLEKVGSSALMLQERRLWHSSFTKLSAEDDRQPGNKRDTVGMLAQNYP